MYVPPLTDKQYRRPTGTSIFFSNPPVLAWNIFCRNLKNFGQNPKDSGQNQKDFGGILKQFGRILEDYGLVDISIILVEI